MARPIEPTPPIRGEDAKKLLRDLEKGAPPAEMNRRIDAAEQYLREAKPIALGEKQHEKVSKNMKNTTDIDVKDALVPFTLRITAKHVADAVCRDPTACVIAQALREAYGGAIVGVEIGSTITKVNFGPVILRYGTPSILQDALHHFDKTGNWLLPEGQFTLFPPSPSMRLGARRSRWHLHHENTDGSGQSKFKTRALPTRSVTRVLAISSPRKMNRASKTN